MASAIIIKPALRFSAPVSASSGNEGRGKLYWAIAMTHAAFRTVTKLAGLHILLSAGTSALPRKLRITKYKSWMRILLVFCRVVLLLGMATYTR
jgi:hypothetical protein